MINWFALLVSVLAALVVMSCIAYYAHRREIVYRQNIQRMIATLELILSGQATEQDWDIFQSLPIRNNLELERIRQECSEIGETEYLGNPFNIEGKQLFSEKGLMLLERQLNQALKLAGKES